MFRSNRDFLTPCHWKLLTPFPLIGEYRYFCLHGSWKPLAHKNVTFRLESGKWIISRHLFPSFGQVHALTLVIHCDELSTLPRASLKRPQMLEKGILKRKSNAGVAPPSWPRYFHHMLNDLYTADKYTLKMYYIDYTCLVILIWKGGVFQNKTSHCIYTI